MTLARQAIAMMVRGVTCNNLRCLAMASTPGRIVSQDAAALDPECRILRCALLRVLVHDSPRGTGPMAEPQSLAEQKRADQGRCTRICQARRRRHNAGAQDQDVCYNRLQCPQRVC